MRKIALTLISVWIGIAHISAQQSAKADSLLQRYREQPPSLERIETALNLYKEFRATDMDRGATYLLAGKRMADSLDLLAGRGKIAQGLADFHIKGRSLDSARHYLSLAEKTFRKTKDSKALFAVYNQWGDFENLEGNFPKALALGDSAVATAIGLKSGLRMVDAHQLKARTHLDQGTFKEAVEEFLLAFRTLDTLKKDYPGRRGILLVGIGRTEVLRDQYQEGIPYLEQGIEIFEAENDTRWLAISEMELASAYFFLKDYDRALEHYRKSLDKSYEMDSDAFVSANLANIGATYMELGQYDKALEYHQRSNELAERRGSVNNLIIAQIDIAAAYRGKKDYPKAIRHYTNAVKLADSIGSIDNLSDSYKERSKAYALAGRYREALSDLEQYQILRDSVFNTTKEQQIEELKTQYETEQKEQQITVQEGKIALLESEAKVGNLQRILLGSGLLLALLGFYGVRQKWKRSKAEKERVDAELAFNKKELTTHALHLAKKNELLENLMLQAQEMKACENTDGYKRLIQTIRFDQHDDRNWDNFTQYFEKVHKDFSRHVQDRYPEVTQNELRFMALLKMNLSSKEIGAILNISPDGVKKARQRLRRKLDLASEASLEAVVHTI